MKVLITGARGFLGQHVTSLLSHDHNLVMPSRLELNLLDPHYNPYGREGFRGAEAIGCFLLNNKVDAVVHLAATCGGIGINKDNPGKFIYENLQMGINVIEGARQANIKKLVLMGTVCMYPKFTPVPFREENIWNGYPEETNAPYGIAKKSVIEMAMAYHRQYGLNVTNLLPANMAGEYDHFDEYSSHVIPAIIKKFEKAVRAPIYEIGKQQPLTHVKGVVSLWGTGSASREFLYAGDCARAIALSLEKDTGPEPMNLGTGREITIAALAETIKEIGGYDAVIYWDPRKLDGQPRRSLDVSRAKERLGWDATTSLEETIRKSIEWYRMYVK